MVVLLRAHCIAALKFQQDAGLQSIMSVTLYISTLLQIDTLLEIWRDYRYETDDMQPGKILPEPPGQRDRLIHEIQFFVENAKEKAKKNGM